MWCLLMVDAWPATPQLQASSKADAAWWLLLPRPTDNASRCCMQWLLFPGCLDGQRQSEASVVVVLVVFGDGDGDVCVVRV